MFVTTEQQLQAVTTPPGGGDIMAFLLRRRWLMLGLARTLAAIGRMRKGPLKLGKVVLVMHHGQVVEALRRDTDFLAAGSYKEEIERTNGPFVLGMDRGPQLSTESRALYTALARVDLKALSHEAATEADLSLAKLGPTFDAVQDYLWPVCGFTTQRMFGLTAIDPVLFRQASRAIFYHVFLDARKAKDVRERAIAAGKLLSGWLIDEIARRRTAGALGDDFMGHLMREATLDDDAVRRTLGGMLVGSIDTINGVAARVLAVADVTPKLRQRMRENLAKSGPFNGYCLEAHRLWAQTPMIVRKAARATSLGGAKLKEGSKVILFTHAAMFDERAFNKAMTLRPDRPAASYLHYGGGVHACAGRALADMQVPMLVARLIARNFQVTGKMGWAGPFPDRLPVRVEDAR